MLERATIGDVAERAGVSIATVSRVVNGRYGVAAATFDRVKLVIDELGYETSLVARSLRSRRTNVIGVLVADIEPFSAEVLKGASNALRGTDYELIVYWSAEDTVFVADVPELPGCMAHGSTPAEAVAAAQDAIALWIDTALEDDRTVPEPKGRRLLLA